MYTAAALKAGSGHPSATSIKKRLGKLRATAKNWTSFPRVVYQLVGRKKSTNNSPSTGGGKVSGRTRSMAAASTRSAAAVVHTAQAEACRRLHLIRALLPRELQPPLKRPLRHQGRGGGPRGLWGNRPVRLVAPRSKGAHFRLLLDRARAQHREDQDGSKHAVSSLSGLAIWWVSAALRFRCYFHPSLPLSVQWVS
jgi:hypothetical protein